MQTLRRVLRRVLLGAATATLALAVFGAATVWVIARHAVGYLRAAHAKSTPVTSTVRAAFLANDPALLTATRFSLRSLSRSVSHGRGCAPTIAFVLVRNLTPHHRMLRWHIETTIATAVVTYLFTPEELLRIYAHEAYFGKVNGMQVYSVDAASAAYFSKPARDLAPAEAAMLIAMLPSPNMLSPFDHAARAIERRNRLLTQMLRRGYIDEDQFRAGIAESLPVPGA